MKAMILAAGVGSRLRPLTDTKPKALIEIGGVAMLERVILNLKSAGVDGIIINLFHLPEQITDFVKSRNSFGIRVEFSHEEALLDTGGGIKKAQWFFDDGQPFFVHNADILTDLDLAKMYRFHLNGDGIATLAAKQRPGSRFLLFDSGGLLKGWQSLAENRTIWTGKEMLGPQRLGFSGIHVLSPEIFAKLTETGPFSINSAYLRLAAKGEKIQAYCGPHSWIDIGKPEGLEAARQQYA